MPDQAEGPISSSIEPSYQLSPQSSDESANGYAPSYSGSAAEKFEAEAELEKGASLTEVVEEKSTETQEEESDPNIVWWDGPDDPQVRMLTPMNDSTQFADGVLESHELASCKEIWHFGYPILSHSPYAAWFIHVRARRATSHERFP